MVTIKCQHSGIEFEAATRRTKQHPLVAEIKNYANKDGSYHEVNNALDAAEKAGGYATIEEYMAKVQAILNGAKERRVELDRKRAEDRKREEAEKIERKRKRQERNAFLKDNGYNWNKVEIGTEEDQFPGGYGAGIGEFSHYEWQLWSPDGRHVTTEQALDGIERGMDVVLAEITAEAAEVERIHEAAEIKREDEVQHTITEQTRRDEWMKQNLSSLVETSTYPDDLDGERTRVVSFETFHFTTNDSFYTAEYGGETIYVWKYGNAVRFFAPAAIVERWNQSKWDAVENKPRKAWDCMDSYLDNFSTYAGDFDEWLVATLGIPVLLELAQRHVPVKRGYGAFSYGTVSKVFRLLTESETGDRGYGEPGETLDIISKRVGKERGEKQFRRYGWVPVGDVLQHEFPEREEIKNREPFSD